MEEKEYKEIIEYYKDIIKQKNQIINFIMQSKKTESSEELLQDTEKIIRSWTPLVDPLDNVFDKIINKKN